MPPRTSSRASAGEATEQGNGSNGSTSRRVSMAGVPMGFQPVPDGHYHSIFNGGEWKEGPKGDYYRAQFTISGDSEEWDGKNLYTNWSLSENSRPVLKAAMSGLGKTDDELEDPAFDLEEELPALVGTPCWVDAKLNAKTGYTEIKKIGLESEG